MNMPKSRDIQAKISLPQAIWNEFWLRYCERKNTLPSCHTKGYFISDYFIFCKAQTPHIDSE